MINLRHVPVTNKLRTKMSLPLHSKTENIESQLSETTLKFILVLLKFRK